MRFGVQFTTGFLRESWDFAVSRGEGGELQLDEASLFERLGLIGTRLQASDRDLCFSDSLEPRPVDLASMHLRQTLPCSERQSAEPLDLITDLTHEVPKLDDVTYHVAFAETDQRRRGLAQCQSRPPLGRLVRESSDRDPGCRAEELRQRQPTERTRAWHAKRNRLHENGGASISRGWPTPQRRTVPLHRGRLHVDRSRCPQCHQYALRNPRSLRSR